MSETISAPPRPRQPRRPAAERRRPVTPPHLWLYRQLTSMRVALALLLIFALLTLAGTLLEQAPSAVRDNPSAYAEWLKEVRPQYGGWTGILDALGFFSIFSSIWFKATLVLLCASLITCSLRRLPGLWRTATQPRMVMTEAFFERAPQRATIASEKAQGAALAALRSAFRKHGFRTAVRRDGDDVHVCADRFRWSPFARVAIHLSFVVILAGAVITATSGFRDEAFTVPVDGKRAVGHGTGLTLEVKSFADTWDTRSAGVPTDYVSQVVLYKDSKPVRRQEIRVNHPMTYDGVTFYQSFFGPAVDLRATTPEGKVAFDGGVSQPYETRDEQHSIGSFSLPRQGLTAYVVSPKSGTVDPRIGSGQTELEIYRTSPQTPVARKVLTQGKAATLAGLDFTFLREREFTGLTVAEDPGSSLIWIGSTLLVLGMFALFFFPHRRVRAVVRAGGGGSEIGVGAVERHQLAFTEQFERLVEGIRRAAGGSAKTETGGKIDA